MLNKFNVKNDFKKYIEKFLIENSKHNLISKNDEKVLFEKHIYDSLSLKLFLDKYSINSANILDIGCGGGFPCIPLAVEYPDFKITAIDSIRKKIDSVNNIKNELKLNNITFVCTRAENFSGKYNIVVSRAVTKLSKLVEYAFPLLEENGFLVAYKSKKVQEEIYEAKNILDKKNAEVIDIIEYKLPLEETFERNLVVIRYKK